MAVATVSADTTTSGGSCSYATANQLSKSINSYVPSYFKGAGFSNSRSEQCIADIHLLTPSALITRSSSKFVEGGVEPNSRSQGDDPDKKGALEHQGNGSVQVYLNDRQLYVVSNIHFHVD